MPKIKPRANYLTHFNEINKALGEYHSRLLGNQTQEDRADLLLDIFDFNRNTSNNDLNYEGLEKNKPTNKNAKKRETNETEYDAIKSVMLYARNVADTIYLTKHIQNLRAYEQTLRQMVGLEEIDGDDAIFSSDELTDDEKKLRQQLKESGALQQYADYIHNFTDTLAGVQKGSKDIRNISNKVKEYVSFVGSNMVGYNVNTPFTNAISGMLGLTKTNKIASLKAVAQMINNLGDKKDGFLERSDLWDL